MVSFVAHEFITHSIFSRSSTTFTHAGQSTHWTVLVFQFPSPIRIIIPQYVTFRPALLDRIRWHGSSSFFGLTLPIQRQFPDLRNRELMACCRPVPEAAPARLLWWPNTSPSLDGEQLRAAETTLRLGCVNSAVTTPLVFGWRDIRDLLPADNVAACGA